jgi:rubrerythrin
MHTPSSCPFEGKCTCYEPRNIHTIEVDMTGEVDITGKPTEKAISQESRQETIAEVMDRVERAEKEHKQKLKRDKYQRKNTVPLNCDDCGKKIGMVYGFDLNGSRFWCEHCLNS